MYLSDNSMKGKVVTLLDDYLSDVDEIALAISVNNFLMHPVSFYEALAIYASLLGMCNEEDGLIDEPLCSRLIADVRRIPCIVVVEKIRNYSHSVRKIIADSMASALCRQHSTLVEQIKGAIHSNSPDVILAMADGAVLVVPEIADVIAEKPDNSKS